MKDNALKNKVRTGQKSEITEHLIYHKLSRAIKDRHNSEILSKISRDEMKHYATWKKYTGRDEKPDLLKVWIYYLISKILGLTFGIKLMERGEGKAESTYREIATSIPDAHTCSPCCFWYFPIYCSAAYIIPWL